MAVIQLTLVLLLITAAGGALVRCTRIGLPIFLVIVGAAASWLPGLDRIDVDPDVFLLLFIPPLLFADARLLPRRDLLHVLQPVQLLALGLVVLTVVVVGYFIHWLVPAMPLAKASAIRIVSLSLDGADETVHDDFRSQKGAFAGTVNAARLFKKHGIEFIINSSFTKRNQEQIPLVYKLAKELGATAWYMFMIVPTGRGEEIMNELISKEDYDKILDWHYDMEKEEDLLLVRPTCAPHYYRVTLQRAREDGEKFKKRTLKFSTGGSKGCLAGQLICLIDVDGNVLPCSYFNLLQAT